MNIEILPKILLFLCLVDISIGMDNDFTVDIPAGHQSCFFETIKTRNIEFEVEYQVIDGGDMDINFFLQAPDGRVLLTESGKSDAAHKFTADIEGDYQLCFDNTFSRFSSKLVFFEILSDENDDENTTNWKNAKEELGTLIDMTVDDFQKLIDNVQTNLDQTELAQTMLRNFEARDRNAQEISFNRVNFLSAVQAFVMISVGLTQVLLIRSLFDDRSRLSKVMRVKT
ncbi:ERP2 [Mytilus edulis]|uniref:TMED5 n=1 Tax=Mytilus edulis TaxID=6550 RepID=A0A8S3R775_MYTED|nr:ERP2 [Mytilus edulis]